MHGKLSRGKRVKAGSIAMMYSYSEDSTKSNGMEDKAQQATPKKKTFQDALKFRD